MNDGFYDSVQSRVRVRGVPKLKLSIRPVKLGFAARIVSFFACIFTFECFVVAAAGFLKT